MENYTQTKAVYAGLLKRLEEANVAKKTVNERIAELEERIPVLDEEKAHLTKLAALAKADSADNAKLGQVRRELADCVDNLESLWEQLAMFQPGGEIMEEILTEMDVAYKAMERTYILEAREAYEKAVEALRADVQRQFPRILALHLAFSRLHLNKDEFFENLFSGIEPDLTLERLPFQCAELSRYAHNRNNRPHHPHHPHHGEQLCNVSSDSQSGFAVSYGPGHRV